MSTGQATRPTDVRARARVTRSMGGPRAPERPPRRPTLSRRHLVWSGLLVLAMLVGLSARAGLHWLANRPMFDIQQVHVLGDLDQVDRDLVRKRALALHGNFFTLDLAAASAELRTVPWVRSVAIRRVWPDTLELAVDEHRPLARWGDNELLNTDGERFVAEYTGVLPYFQGPKGSETLMFREYHLLRAQLAGVPLAITDLELSDRGAWRLTADNGLELELGRDDVHGRLARFITVYPQLLRVASPAGAVADLRYARGFALRAARGVKDPNS